MRDGGRATMARRVGVCSAEARPVARTLLALALCGIAGAAGAQPPSPDRQQALEHLLRHDCGSCHGMTLRGGLGPALTPDALAEKPDEYLVHSILEGRPGTAMPPWKRFLSQEEAQWLVNSLRRQSQ